MLLRFAFLLVFLLLSISCSGGAEPTPVIPSEVVSPPSPVDPAPAAPILLTKQAEELRRVREEHAALIRSIPSSPEPTSTPTVAERSYGGLGPGPPVSRRRSAASPVGEDWFDPDKGLTFYRDRGDDWTERRVRENHPHRGLFYYSEYPDSVLNFSDRSIHRPLARELVFEAALVLPLLGDPTPAMIDAFSRNLGWELRDSPEPAVNLWTIFTVRREGVVHSYAVGGVMVMGVASVGDGNDLVEYVTPGRWVGPVVVERLR